MDTTQLQTIANVLRKDSLMMTTAAGSGHPTSCLSAAEIMSALFFEEMRYDTKNSLNPDNDEFILSKGHAAPILYSALFRSGCINEDLNSLRKINSPLEGHPVPASLDWIKVGSGSLGQGLGVGVGMALACRLQKRSFRTFVLMGDSEVAEGSVFEAMALAGYYKLNNLVAFVDINRLGQRGETMLGHDLKTYKKRFSGFGWEVKIINGHNLSEIKKLLVKSRKSKKPTLILAKTLKGKGVSFIENKENWHGKALSSEELEKALKEVPDIKMPKIAITKPQNISQVFRKRARKIISYPLGFEESTRQTYGKALASLATEDSSVVAVDAEVSNSTFSSELKKVDPKRFIESFISEQTMASVALGLSKKGHKVFASTFSAFLTRAHDQIRMASISSGDMTFVGSHAGVSIGEDGGSQMGIEDISMFRSLFGSNVFYPSEAISTQKLLALVKDLKGVSYLRTTRSKTPVLYGPKEEFRPGDFKVIKKSLKDKAVFVGSGVTVFEAIKAAEILQKKKINVAVIDLYSIKPFKHKKFFDFVKKHGNKIVLAEDHRKEGGIGEMIMSKIAGEKIVLRHLAVDSLPHSGKIDQLLKKHNLDANAYVRAFNS